MTGYPRRRILGGTAAGVLGLGLTGCGLFTGDPAPPAPPDALQPLLDEAVALAVAYDRAAVAQPGLAWRLAPLAANHREHAAALSRLIGRPVPSAPTAPPAAPPASAATTGTVPPASAPPATTTLAALRAAEQTAQRNAAAACAQAPADRAALVGSIAAGRATHAEALR